MTTKPALFSILTLVLLTAFAFYLAGLKPTQTQTALDEVTTELLSGESLVIPQQAGAWRLKTDEHLFTALLGFKQVGQQKIGFCEQLTNPNKIVRGQKEKAMRNGKLIPIKIGSNWKALQLGIKQRLDRGETAHNGLRNVLLDTAEFDIPAIEIVGNLLEEPLTIKIKSLIPQFYMASGPDSGINAVTQNNTVNFYNEAWLFWQNSLQPEVKEDWLGDYAIQLKRTSSQFCSASRITITIYKATAEEMKKQKTWQLYKVPNIIEGELKLKHVNITAGATKLSPQLTPKTEDGALFNRLLKTGLVRLGNNKQIISAPKDLARIKQVAPEFVLDKQLAESFTGIQWDKATASAQADFYGQQAGPYVRAQIKRFNQERLLAAVRLKSANNKAKQLIKKIPLYWQADVATHKLDLQTAMPLLASSLFKQIPTTWMPWQRVKKWPTEASPQSIISFATNFKQAATGKEQFELITLGKKVSVTGAKIIQQEDRCLKPKCSKNERISARWFLIKLNKGTKTIKIQLQAEQAVDMKKLYRSEFRHIILDKQGKLSWQFMAAKGIRQQQVDVSIYDRHGTPLWQNATLQPEASQGGLGSFIGIGYQHESSLVGMFSRLNTSQIDAQLSIDLNMQTLAQTVLEQGVEAVSADKKFKGKDDFQHQRSAALLVMDADSGEILAMAGYPKLPEQSKWQDVVGFDAKRTSESPLRVRAIQQLGTSHNRPGSTFKLITSLLLEQQAKTNPTIEQLLAGVTQEQLNQIGAENNYSFTAEAGCYPAIYAPYSRNCPWGAQKGGKYRNKPVITNFGVKDKFHETPKREMEKSKNSVYGVDSDYGLKQGLRDSLNTWYVWLYELTDKTLLGQGDTAGVPHTRALVVDALDQARPINKIMRSVGFGQALDLSGGLLADDFNWHYWDVLHTTPTQMDVLDDRHRLRQMSIGIRSFVTPLNMALVSASIASETWVRPILLSELEGQSAELAEFLPLDINTDRIRKGMKRVPQDGSSQGAFKGKYNKWLREYIYAKTGTAPVKIFKKGKFKTEVNTAWITGWLEAGAIDKEERNLVFVCQITHSKSTGGASCGPVIQQFFTRLKTPEIQKNKMNSHEYGL